MNDQNTASLPSPVDQVPAEKLPWITPAVTEFSVTEVTLAGAGVPADGGGFYS